jgi:hypothetical protein
VTTGYQTHSASNEQGVTGYPLSVADMQRGAYAGANFIKVYAQAVEDANAPDPTTADLMTQRAIKGTFGLRGSG